MIERTNTNAADIPAHRADPASRGRAQPTRGAVPAAEAQVTYLTITEAKKILDNAIHRAIIEFRTTTDESISALRIDFIETTTMGARRDFEVSRIEIEVIV